MRAGGDGEWVELDRAHKEGPFYFCCHFLDPLLSRAAQRGAPQFCTHLNTGAGPRSPIATVSVLHGGSEQMLPSCEEASGSNPAGPRYSGHHFSALCSAGCCQVQDWAVDHLWPRTRTKISNFLLCFFLWSPRVMLSHPRQPEICNLISQSSEEP